MNLLARSRSRIADIVAEQLALHFAGGGERPSFFALPGQDPTAFELPAQSLSALYWQGTPEQRRRFIGVLLDLAGRRADSLPLQALQALLLTVGSIGKPEALLPLVRVLGARSDLGDQTYNLFGIALQVARGLGPVRAAWDAVYEMAGFKDKFPEKFVFDAFDICVVDERSPWERWFERLEPAMMRVTNVSRQSAMERRLTRSAEAMASRMSTVRIERGLKALLGRGVLEPKNAELLIGQWPRQMLAAKLLVAPSAPLRICRGADDVYFLVHAASSDPPQPQQEPRPTAELPRALRSLQLEPDRVAEV